MEIDLARRVLASPATLWALLTDPDRMNAWSTARVEGVDPGLGGRFDGVGALRRVTTPPPARARLSEVVRTSEPGRRFRYVVYAGAPLLRSHVGTITLEPDGDHTLLRWRVAMAFVLPGMPLISRRTIEPELSRSLDRLAHVAKESADVALPPPEPSWDPGDLTPLRAEAEAVLAEQRALADRLEAANDPKQWFARVYELVTRAQLAHLDAGEVDHPDWVLRLIPRFHVYYLENLERFRGVRPGAAEPAWQRAWSAAERGDARTAPRQVVKGLLYGVAAHIEADLPRALADVQRAHYRDRTELVRFRCDYVRMAPVFRHASRDLLRRMPASFLPWSVRLARAALPPELEDQVLRRYYDVVGRRLEAFEKARVACGSQPETG